MNISSRKKKKEKKNLHNWCISYTTSNWTPDVVTAPAFTLSGILPLSLELKIV